MYQISPVQEEFSHDRMFISALSGTIAVSHIWLLSSSVVFDMTVHICSYKIVMRKNSFLTLFNVN